MWREEAFKGDETRAIDVPPPQRAARAARARPPRPREASNARIAPCGGVTRPGSDPSEAQARHAGNAARLDGARDLPRVFDLVKEVVERDLGKSRAGIMLGLSEMGAAPDGFLGGYFVVGSNAIVLNRTVLRYIETTAATHDPRALNAYAFHVLLHEYLHTLGWFSEDDVRPLARDVSLRALGAEHPATVIAQAMVPGEAAGAVPDYFRKLAYPPVGWVPPRPMPIEIVKGFDPGASPYIM